MTPLPWKREVYEHGGSRIYVESESGRMLIADTYQRGDADLFSTAPQLLEALSWALDLLDMYDEMLLALGGPKEKVLSQAHLDGKKRARATIAAAEGRA